MGKKKVAPRTRTANIRMTEQECEKIQEYCDTNGISISEYFRLLARTHLNIGDDMKVVKRGMADKIK
jgi:hypothetical protein